MSLHTKVKIVSSNYLSFVKRILIKINKTTNLQARSVKSNRLFSNLLLTHDEEILSPSPDRNMGQK